MSKFIVQFSLVKETKDLAATLSEENADTAKIIAELDRRYREEQGIDPGAKCWNILFKTLLATTKEQISQPIYAGKPQQAMQFIDRIAQAAVKAQQNRLDGKRIRTTYAKKLPRRQDENGQNKVASRPNMTIKNIEDWFTPDAQPGTSRDEKGQIEVVDYTPAGGFEEFTPYQYRLLETFFTDNFTYAMNKVKDEQEKTEEEKANAAAVKDLFETQGTELAARRAALFGSEYKPRIAEKRVIKRTILKPTAPSATKNMFDVLADETLDDEEKPTIEFEIHLQPSEKAISQPASAWSYVAALGTKPKEQPVASSMLVLGEQ